MSTFLRNLTDSEKSSINGTSDIFAHHAYTSSFYMAPDAGISACLSNTSNPLYPGCYNSTNTYPANDNSWNIGFATDPDAPRLHKIADWLVPFLHYIQTPWHPAGGIAVSEFGFAEPYEELRTLVSDMRCDYARTMYYRDYLYAILTAISEDVNVVGCLSWSILNNLEWADGYTTKFGMQYVNFTTQERYFKSSYFQYVSMFRDNQQQ